MYTFKSEKELENIIRIDKSIPNKVIENAKYHIGLVEDSYEDGACGNFHILTDDNGIDSVSYKDCLSHCNLDEDEYEFDDLICIDNSSEWHVRAYIGTEAYWVFFYRDCRRELFSKINGRGQTILMVTHSTKAASKAGRVLFIKDGEVFHQIYKASMTDEEMYTKISDTLTVLATGGESLE